MDERFYAGCSRGFTKELSEFLRKEAHKNELLEKSPTIVFCHGDRNSVCDVSGTSHESSFTESQAIFEIHDDVIASGDREQFLASIRKGVDQLRVAITKQIFESVGEAAERVGNVVDFGGKPIDGDAICSLFEMIEISFDKNGKAEMPMLCIHPDMEESVREILDDSVVRLRLDVILRKKWFDRYSL
jgi:hypothetical protein